MIQFKLSMNSFYEENNLDSLFDYSSLFYICPKLENFSYEKYCPDEKYIHKKNKIEVNKDKEMPFFFNIANKDMGNQLYKKLFNEDFPKSLANQNEKDSSFYLRDFNYDKGKKKRKKEIFKIKDNNRTEHNKFSDDNLRRKCKHLVLKYLMKFINDKILDIYNGNIGKGISEKQLKLINQSQIINCTVNFNKRFLRLKIKDIFSTNISKKYSYFPISHNKILINGLLNEPDENKKYYFTKLFNLEFIECLRTFRGEKHIDILEGFKSFDDIKDEIITKYKDDGEKYYDSIKYYLDNYEKITLKKTPKNRKKNNP